MINPGPYLRKNFPGFYFTMVFIINSVKNGFRPYSIYITDSLGGSFKDYFITSDMKTRLADLKRNLDKESVETIDVIIKRLLNYPDEKFKHKIPKRHKIVGGLLEVESHQNKILINKKLNIIKKRLKFPSRYIEESVFYYCHGLSLLPESVKEYIKDEDFIDAGAFIGDSAVALNDYRYGKIFSVEMSKKSIARYKVNMARCNIGINKFVIINAGIVSNDNPDSAEFLDTGSPGLSLLRIKGKYDPAEVPLKSVDTIVREYKISPKFIKVDIEGNGLEFIRGAKNTLINFRPVLSVAIYHNPVEFFEAKPMLEDILADYMFMIRKLTSGIRNNQCHSEVVLIGYPKELIINKTN